MYTFGVTKWLISNIQSKYNKISFMARDGYLIMETYKIMKNLYDNMPQEEYIYVSRKALIPIMIVNKLDFYKLQDILKIENHTPISVLNYISKIITIDKGKLETLCSEQQIQMDQNFKDIEQFNRFIKMIIQNFYNEEEHLKNREKLKSYFDLILGDKSAIFDVGYSGRPEFYLSELCKRPIDTYFLNINTDEALEYENLGKFELNTFFPAKPTATGNAYELLLSKLGPSCIAYNIEENKVTPVFEEYNNKYQIEYIVQTMQEAALQFVKDIVEIFGKEIDVLYYQDYYITLPILAYFNSARKIDKQPLSAVEIEDDIGRFYKRKMLEDMQEDLYNKNQKTLNILFKPKKKIKIFKRKNNNVKNETLKYNSVVDLSERSKLVRLLYYGLFDRDTMKRRIKEILKK